jgi:divalent metal cation (Fe/Co/Zn/Cd) transporter
VPNESGRTESTRTVFVAIGADLGVGLAKVGAAVFTGSSAMAAAASDSLADTTWTPHDVEAGVAWVQRA